jgi:diguanylate cyclase (GGDEF)-like protein
MYSILAVDDEKANLAVLNQILSAEYSVYMAKSGAQALQLIGKNRPDLILLDILMPEMDGFEVLAKLKEDPGTKKIPVICITGLDSEDDEEKGLRLGAADYIKKPFKPALVKARISTQMEIVHQMRTIERLGLTDSLTDISNRRSFDDRLEMEWRRAIREKKPLSFLMMDLDKFKHYNDTYGHPQGDALLKAVAKIFSAKAQRPADLPARLGGEEFGVLLPDTGLEAALLIAESIRADVEDLQVPTADGSEMTAVTISIGVVSAVPEENDSIKDFICSADKNLYAAKTAGRNSICTQAVEGG